MILKLLKITQSNIDKYTRRVFTMFNGNSTTVTAVQYGSHGEDSNAIKDSIGIYTTTELDGKEVCLGVMNKNAKAELGERRLFCTDENGTFMYNMWLRADGKLLIGNSEVPAEYTNFAVKYNELKIGFDNLKTELNTFIATYNTHIHPVANAIPNAPGPVVAIATLNTGTPATATIDQSKHANIKYNE